jgi:hypothetical protein
VQVGKPRYDLIPVVPLRRLADLYARGAEKYGEGNFEKGMPFRRVYASLLRHIYQYAEGDRTEDHLAAVAWNAFALMFFEEQIRTGKLPAQLDDMSPGPVRDRETELNAREREIDLESIRMVELLKETESLKKRALELVAQQPVLESDERPLNQEGAGI